MANTQTFQSQAAQLVSALEVRGRQYLPSSKAEISVSELEAHQDAFYRLTRLPNQLNLTGNEPLSLAEARVLYKSSTLDTLCSVLNRLPWNHFCTQLGTLVCHGRGFIIASSAFDCIYDLLRAYRRVQPSDVAAARLEVFGRCILWQEGSAYRLRWVRLVFDCGKSAYRLSWIKLGQTGV